LLLIAALAELPPERWHQKLYKYELAIYLIRCCFVVAIALSLVATVCLFVLNVGETHGKYIHQKY
jgi:hypothetical protein